VAGLDAARIHGRGGRRVGLLLLLQVLLSQMLLLHHLLLLLGARHGRGVGTALLSRQLLCICCRRPSLLAVSHLRALEEVVLLLLAVLPLLPAVGSPLDLDFYADPAGFLQHLAFVAAVLFWRLRRTAAHTGVHVLLWLLRLLLMRLLLLLRLLLMGLLLLLLHMVLHLTLHLLMMMHGRVILLLLLLLLLLLPISHIVRAPAAHVARLFRPERLLRSHVLLLEVVHALAAARSHGAVRLLMVHGALRDGACRRRRQVVGWLLLTVVLALRRCGRRVLQWVLSWPATFALGRGLWSAGIKLRVRILLLSLLLLLLLLLMSGGCRCRSR